MGEKYIYISIRFSFLKTINNFFKILLILLITVNCSEGFESLTDETALSDIVTDVNKTTPYAIKSLNAKFSKNFPAIFYLESNDPATSIEIIAWEHWYGIGEKCPSPKLNSDGTYEVNCGTNTGSLSIFLSLRINQEKDVTIFNEIQIEDTSLTEEEVFPEGRSL